MLNTTSLKDPIFVPEMGGPLLVGLISERHWGRQAETSGSEMQTGGDNTEVRGADRRRVGSGGGTQSSFPDRGATVIGPVTRGGIRQSRAIFALHLPTGGQQTCRWGWCLAPLLHGAALPISFRVWGRDMIVLSIQLQPG